MRRLAEIDKEVVMVGVVDRVEIWASHLWDRFENENAEAFEELEDVLTGSGPPGEGQ